MFKCAVTASMAVRSVIDANVTRAFFDGIRISYSKQFVLMDESS